MRKIKKFLLSALLVLTGSGCFAGELRGVWVRPVSVQAVDTQLDTVAKAGFNAVFVETFYHGYTIYPSSAAPQNPRFADTDMLRLYADGAKRRHLKLYCWLETFYWGFNADGEKLTPLLEEHPEYKTLLKDGRDTASQEDGHVFASPGNPAVRAVVSAIITEILSRYNADGVALDYLRYSAGTLDAGYESAAEFKKIYGKDPARFTSSPDDADWRKWVDFRAEYVLQMLVEAKRALVGAKPDAVLAAAVFPSSPEQLYTLTRFQNWRAMLWRGLPDVLLPMCYAPDMSGVEKELQTVAAAMPEDSRTLVYPVIAPAGEHGGVYGGKHPLAARQADIVRKMGFAGFSVFCYDWIAGGEGFGLLTDR